VSKKADDYRAAATQMLAVGNSMSVSMAHAIQILALDTDVAELRARLDALEAPGLSDQEDEAPVNLFADGEPGATHHGTHRWTAEDHERGKRNAEILKAKGLL
jgi:hypothetical protein